jgi:hypothetical protein
MPSPGSIEIEDPIQTFFKRTFAERYRPLKMNKFDRITAILIHLQSKRLVTAQECLTGLK